MFAEDVGLLPGNMFTRMLESALSQPEQSAIQARKLFGAMSKGGSVGFDTVDWFNGGLFDNDSALPLDKNGIETTLRAAALDWSEVEPAILGTLFERGLDPDKRAQLGAHYTDREKIMRIIDPVVVRPLLAEWNTVKEEIGIALDRARQAKTKAATARQRAGAERRLQLFLERLKEFTVLDPACGSGNFLYLALHALKDLEHRVQLEAEALGLQRAFPSVSPANVRGIEINAYAAELARVSIWIGEIQWMRRNGFTESREPILKPLDTIECRDAILTPEGKEPEWPNADVVVGNPPFLGNRRIRRELGDYVAETLPVLYKGMIRGKPDLVCYWFAKSARLVADGRVRRVGLVATNSIRGGTNRAVLDSILGFGCIFDAWSDEPWVIDGASVRVSLVCFGPQSATLPVSLNGERGERINADLTGQDYDLTSAGTLTRNVGVAFQGDIKRGSFDIPGDLARDWLRLPGNPHGRPNSDVLRPWVNGMDLARRPAGKWIVGFGASMTEEEAALYEAPFDHVLRQVKDARQQNREPESREFWYRHWRPRPEMWAAIAELRRYVATPRVAKHRIFVWLDRRVCPDSAIIAIARDDDTTFGILHSRFHEAWSLRLGTWLGVGNDPRYTPTSTFETFPFPVGLSPDIPATEHEENPRAIAIADAARRLVELRDRWLNPPEWVEWVDEPASGYPRRAVPRNEAAAKAVEQRTLTNLYNDRPQWLADAHRTLDAAVAQAYGWEADITEEEALARLLDLNLS